jgi:hypothetical protein
MEENKESKNSKFFKELESRSKAVNTSNKLNFVKTIISVLNLASLIWIFNICFTSCIKWWQLLIFIIIMIISFAVISAEEIIKFSKVAEEMLNEQKKELNNKSKNKTKKDDR